MKELTRVQKRIFDYVQAYIKEMGFSPSYIDIAKQFNYHSRTTVKNHLLALQQKGYISREKGQQRAIKILKQEND